MEIKSGTSTILTNRQKYWLEHFRICKVAGSNYSDYARSHGLNINTFHSMINRLRRLGVVERPPGKTVKLFKKISVQKKVSSFSEVRLCLPNGVCIEFSSHFESTTLPALLQSAAQIK